MMGGLMLIVASIAAPIVTGGLIADATYGSDAQTAHAYPSSVLAGQAGYLDVLGPGRFSLEYSPRLTLANTPEPGASHVAFFQSAAAGWLVHDGTEVYGLAQAVSFGQQDFSLLTRGLATGAIGPGTTAGAGGTGTSGTPLQPGQISPDRQPVQRFVSTLNSITAASFQELFSPRVTGSALASFSVGGGQGSVGRATLPLQRSGNLTLASAFKVTRLDSVTVSASGIESLTGPDQESRSGNAQVVWGRELDPDLRGTAGIGVAVLYNSVTAATATTAVNTNAIGNQGTLVAPTALASLAWNVPVRAQHLAFAVNSAVAPALDPFTGATYLRGAVRLSAGWTPIDDWTLSAAAVGDRILGGLLSGAYGAGGDASIVHRLSPSMSAHLGVRAALVAPDHPLRAEEGPPSLWAVFAGFSSAFPGAPRR
jgi:hypothetical protein